MICYFSRRFGTSNLSVWHDKVLQCIEFAFMIRWGRTWLFPDSNVKSYSAAAGLTASLLSSFREFLGVIQEYYTQSKD